MLPTVGLLGASAGSRGGEALRARHAGVEPAAEDDGAAAALVVSPPSALECLPRLNPAVGKASADASGMSFEFLADATGMSFDFFADAPGWRT